MKNIVARQCIIAIIVACVASASSVSAAFSKITVSQEEYCKTNTAICGTASEPLTLLMGFVREMMNSIRTMGTEGDYLGQYVNPDRYAGNVFTPPKKTIVGRVARNISQKIKFGVASLSIFASPINGAGLKDVGGSTVLLVKNKVFLRDSKIIQELESQVSDKKYELGLGGGWYQKINPTNRALMQTIIQKYIDKGLLLPGSLIKDGALYNNVTSLLIAALSAAKTFIYFDEIGQFDQINRGGVDGVIITFDTLAMKQLEFDYACVAGPYNICSTEGKKFSAAMKSLKTAFSAGVSSATKTFKDAVKRLGQVFTKGEDQTEEFKAREAELLVSMYGTQKVKKGLLFGSPVKVTSDAGEKISQLGSDVAKFWQFPNNINDATSQVNAPAIAKDTEAPYNNLQDTFTAMMSGYLSDVFANQKTDIDAATLAEVKQITYAFSVLGEQIDVIKNDILGSKDKGGSLIESLGQACKLQCGTIGRCR